MNARFVFPRFLKGLAALLLAMPLLCGCLPAKTTPAAVVPTAIPVVNPTPNPTTAPTPAPTAAPTLALTAVDAGRTVTLKPGQLLTVTLEGNPSTGYTWEAVPPVAGVLAQVGEAEARSQSDLIGAPVNLMLTFQAGSEGRQFLQLVYHRSWEKDVPPVNSFDVTVVVSQTQPASPTSLPTRTADPRPTQTTVAWPAAGQRGWLTYTNPDYGFAFQYPPDWKLEAGKGTLTGHSVLLTPATTPNVTLQVAFKRSSEAIQLGRTGMGSGDLVMNGRVLLLGKEVERQVLVSDGKHMTVRYLCANCMTRGELEFGFDLDYRGSWADSTALPPQVEAQADLVVASVKLTK